MKTNDNTNKLKSNKLFLQTMLNDKISYVLNILKWLILGAVTGVICGYVGTLFYKAVQFATNLRLSYSWLLFLLPVAGVIIVFSYHICGIERDKGTNLILDSIHSDEKVPFKMAPLIFLSTALTHLCGGSSGREGAALQIGGSIGAFLGNVFHLDDKDIRIITMCGMSAVFSALFGTPITATIFSIEVVSVGILHYSAFMPCIVASTVSYAITKGFGISETMFPLVHIPTLSIHSCFQVIVLAIICGIISILFCSTMHHAAHIYRKWIKNDYLRIITGSVLVIALTLLIGTRDYNGAGMNVILNAFTGQSRPEAFLLKILFTAITLGAGFKGGEIVPTIFIGATLGNVVAPLLGLPSDFGAAIGVISLFCSVVNCPIAAIMLSLEVFGTDNILLFCIACGISYVFSGYYGLYSSQKIVYSKLHPNFLNRTTH